MSAFTFKGLVLFCAILLLPQICFAKTKLGDWSLKLESGMSEQTVIKVLGQHPDKVELSTCGALTKTPWQCKKLIYSGEHYDELWIYMQQGQGGIWYVNGWNVD